MPNGDFVAERASPPKDLVTASGSCSARSAFCSRPFGSEGFMIRDPFIASSPRRLVAPRAIKAVIVTPRLSASVSSAMGVKGLAETIGFSNSTFPVFGGLDVLVNDAGVEHRFPFVLTPDEVWEFAVGVNLTGPYLCSKAAVKQTIMQRRGVRTSACKRTRGALAVKGSGGGNANR